MKVISFKEGQSGSEWLEWRKTGVGASDVGVLMGSNTYKTVHRLWNEKAGFAPDTAMNPAIAHGIKNEPFARDWVNKDQELELEPICLEYMNNTDFKASLDGYDHKSRTLCEIKCPVSPKILENAKEKQRVPKYWLHQVQWQMMIADPIRAFIAVWDADDESCTLIECYAEPETQEKMREKAADFVRSLKLQDVPKAFSMDYVNLKDDDLKTMLLEYKELLETSEKHAKTRKELRDKIEAFSDGGNFKCAGFSFMRYPPRVTYDMDKMRDDGITIDKYIKNKNRTEGYFRIIPPKAMDKYGNRLRSYLDA